MGSLMENIQKADDIYIYGAGNWGNICYKYLELVGVKSFRGFIVSDGQEKKNDRVKENIMWLSEAVSRKVCGTIIVAMSGNNSDIVSDSLHQMALSNSFDVFKVSEQEYFEMYRMVYPISINDFMLHSAPADDSNGGARGTTISRYYIRKFLDYACPKIGLSGEVHTCEVGDLRYSRKYYPDADNSVIDYKVGQDLTKIDTLPNSKYDVFICTQVYNFLFDVPAAIKGSYHLLKNGGYLVCTVVGNISQVIRGDMEDYGDYWRFTYLGIRKLMEQVFDTDKIEIISYGNALASTAYIQGLCVEDLPCYELLNNMDPEYSLVIGIIARK